jgi:predicted transcriptional regulator
MKMSYALASRYSNIFEVMQSPYALIILDYLFENRTAKTVDDLVSISKSTQSTVTALCEKLVRLSILDKEYEGSVQTYKALDSRYANFVEKVIEVID